MAFLKLGWRNPRPNDFQGPDLKPLRDLFGNLQHFLTWPHVWLTFSGNMDLTGAFASIPWTVQSGAANPFVPGDPYNLYRPATSQVQVPRDFDTWLAIGVAGALFSSGAANSLRTVQWHYSGTAIQSAVVQVDRGVIGGINASCTLMRPVRKGGVLDVRAASSDATVDITAAEAFVYFLPLA